MHDLRVALDRHVLVGLDRAELGDAADVVAAEVHQHDVLGALLLAGAQLLLERAVLLGGRGRAAACRRSGRTSTTPSVRRTSTSGEEPTSAKSPSRRKYM